MPTGGGKTIRSAGTGFEWTRAWKFFSRNHISNHYQHTMKTTYLTLITYTDQGIRVVRPGAAYDGVAVLPAHGEPDGAAYPLLTLPPRHQRRVRERAQVAGGVRRGRSSGRRGKAEEVVDPSQHPERVEAGRHGAEDVGVQPVPDGQDV